MARVAVANYRSIFGRLREETGAIIIIGLEHSSEIAVSSTALSSLVFREETGAIIELQAHSNSNCILLRPRGFIGGAKAAEKIQLAHMP